MSVIVTSAYTHSGSRGSTRSTGTTCRRMVWRSASARSSSGTVAVLQVVVVMVVLPTVTRGETSRRGADKAAERAAPRRAHKDQNCARTDQNSASGGAGPERFRPPS